MLVARSTHRAGACLRCLANLHLGAAFPGHAYPPEGYPTMQAWWEDEMKRRERKAELERAGGLSSDPRFGEEYPHLVEALTADAYDDGAKRERSKLSVRVEGGAWNVGLSEPEAQETAWVTAETLERAFQALDKGLARGSLDWRAWPGTGGKRKK